MTRRSKVGLYLAVVIDMLRWQVVGRSMQPHMNAGLATDALRIALRSGVAWEPE